VRNLLIQWGVRVAQAWGKTTLGGSCPGPLPGHVSGKIAREEIHRVNMKVGKSVLSNYDWI